MAQIVVLLAIFGLICLVWLAYGWLLLPGRCPMHVVVTAAGEGEGLEQTIRGLLWLRRCGLWNGSIVIRDGGLSREGLTLTLLIARREGVEFCGRAPEL